MGNRASIVVKSQTDQVVLYTHWNGDELIDVAKKSLNRGKSRWNDLQYLARIIFSDMIAGDERSTTGFGISGRIGAGDDKVITICLHNQAVSINGRPAIGFIEFIENDHEWSES